MIPAGTPIEFSLTSATVMNSFFVPQLGSQIYTMPGMTTQLNLLAQNAGEYPGFSAQFSGDGFADMRFMVHAVSANEFPAWIERTHADGKTLDPAAYRTLSTAGSVAVESYRSVAPHFYEWIVRTTLQAPSEEP